MTSSTEWVRRQVEDIAESESRLVAAQSEHERAVECMYVDVREHIAEVRDVDPGLAMSVAQDVYWNEPAVPVRVIEDGLGVKRNTMWLLAGDGPVVSQCRKCGDDLRATSRSMAFLKPGSRAPWRCDACEHRDSERAAAIIREADRRERELAVVMPEAKRQLDETLHNLGLTRSEVDSGLYEQLCRSGAQRLVGVSQ